MIRQGPELAIERLHPEFAKRLAAAIREGRHAGLGEVGIFSAYRPPVFGVGGFADKFHSLHAYGLAVDIFGIGAPSSAESKMWHETAARHGIICPYGYRDRMEWNHCQSTRLMIVKPDNPLRATITGQGPIDLAQMFAVGARLIGDVQIAIRSVLEMRTVHGGRRATNRHHSLRRDIPTRTIRKRRIITYQVIAKGRAVPKLTAKRRALKRPAGRTKVALVSRQTETKIDELHRSSTPSLRSTHMRCRAGRSPTLSVLSLEAERALSMAGADRYDKPSAHH
jgi:hypothetical protein